MIDFARLTLWLRRIEVISAVCAIGFIGYIYWAMTAHGDDLLDNQTNKLARSLTSLAAFNATNYIQSDQHAKLQQLVNTLVKENFVLDATIYNNKGESLAKSKYALPLRSLLPMSGSVTIPTQGIGRRPYIAAIVTSTGENLGYLRITLEQSSLLNNANDYIHSAQLMSKVMLILALWVGFVFARLISTKRRRHIKIAHRRQAIRDHKKRLYQRR